MVEEGGLVEYGEARIGQVSWRVGGAVTFWNTQRMDSGGERCGVKWIDEWINNEDGITSRIDCLV